MITAISAKGNTLTSEYDLRFGRGAWFCIYNEETGETTFIENKNTQAQSGAGTKASEKLVSLGVKKIISGDFGPKAKELLQKLHIQMVILRDENLTIHAIIDLLKTGK